jgi:hypothetical protein
MSGILVLRHLCLLFLLCNANIFIRLVEGHNSTTPEPPLSTPASRFTPGDDVSLDRLFAINTDLLTAPAGVAGGDCTIRTSSLVPNGTFTVVLPPPIPDNNTESFETIHARTLNVSLPYLLEQIGVHPKEIPALVSKGIPLFEAAIKASLCSDPAGHNVRRGIFGDIVHFVEHAVSTVVSTVVHGVEEVVVDTTCSVFAAGALPGYLTVAALLRVENIAQIPRATTPDQDFFIFPLHGPISHNDGISVFYSAKLPPGFGDTLGVTIGRNIYVRAGLGTIDSSNAGFPSATSILLHEFTHSKQYQALGYSLPAFGSQYLFNFCKVSLGLPYLDPMLIEIKLLTGRLQLHEQPYGSRRKSQSRPRGPIPHRLPWQPRHWYAIR